LCELDKPVLRQGVSQERMEIGIRAVVASQAASVPLKEIAQLRDEAGTIREIRKQLSPILPLEQVVDEAHERGGIEIPLAGELAKPHPVRIREICVRRSLDWHLARLPPKCPQRDVCKAMLKNARRGLDRGMRYSGILACVGLPVARGLERRDRGARAFPTLIGSPGAQLACDVSLWSAALVPKRSNLVETPKAGCASALPRPARPWAKR